MLETELELLPRLIADAAEPLPEIEDRTFGEFFDHFPVERRNVAGFSTGAGVLKLKRHVSSASEFQILRSAF